VLIEPIFVLFCNTIGTETQGNAQIPCQNAINATSIETKTTQTFQELESYSQNYVYKNMDPTLIKSLIAAGFLVNSYSTKTVIAQFPLQPFEFNCHVQPNNVQYGLKLKIDF